MGRGTWGVRGGESDSGKRRGRENVERSTLGEHLTGGRHREAHDGRQDDRTEFARRESSKYSRNPDFSPNQRARSRDGPVTVVGRADPRPQRKSPARRSSGRRTARCCSTSLPRYRSSRSPRTDLRGKAPSECLHVRHRPNSSAPRPPQGERVPARFRQAETLEAASVARSFEKHEASPQRSHGSEGHDNRQGHDNRRGRTR
jgi:hypothetical protein